MWRLYTNRLPLPFTFSTDLAGENADDVFTSAVQINEWLIANKLSLSLDKTCYMFFFSFEYYYRPSNYQRQMELILNELIDANIWE